MTSTTNRNKRFIDEDHLFMTEDKEAEMRLQGIEFWGQRKGKWEGNTRLKKKCLMVRKESLRSLLVSFFL